jgi:hypothetical protein
MDCVSPSFNRDANLNTVFNFRYRRHIKAGTGKCDAKNSTLPSYREMRENKVQKQLPFISFIILSANILNFEARLVQKKKKKMKKK